MQKLILINSLSDLCEYFYIKILKHTIIIEADEKFKSELKSLYNYFWVNGYKCRLLNLQLQVDYDAIPAHEAEYHDGSNPKILPELNIFKLVYPQPKSISLKEGEFVVGSYKRKDMLYQGQVFVNDNDEEFILSYAQIDEFKFIQGAAYEISCVGCELKTARNKYPRKIFEIHQISKANE